MSNTVAVSRRALLWIAGGLAALLVVAIVLVSILLTTMSRAAEEDDYQACMARHGFAHDEQANLGDGSEDEWVDSIAAAAEACSR